MNCGGFYASGQLCVNSPLGGKEKKYPFAVYTTGSLPARHVSRASIMTISNYVYGVPAFYVETQRAVTGKIYMLIHFRLYYL